MEHETTDADVTADFDIAAALRAAESPAEFLSLWLTHDLLPPESQRLLKDYYANWRQMRSARLRYFYTRQLQEVSELIQTFEQPRLLEIGTGFGSESLWFAMNGIDVTGIDALSHYSDIAKERLAVLENILGRDLKCQLHTTPLLHFEDADGFDIIWLEQTFHHLEPREAVVRKISQLLRPGGYVVLSEANALNPLLQLQLLRVRGLRMFVTLELESGPVVIGNERVISAYGLDRELKRTGINKTSLKYFRLFPASAVFDSLFSLERRFTSALLAPFYTHYNFVGRKTDKRH